MDNQKETICYFVFATGSANGGHYRSLITIAESLLDKYNIIVLNIGYVYSHIIKNSDVSSYYIYFNGLNIWKTLVKIKKITNGLNIKCLHAFDSQSYLLARILSGHNKIPVIITKCGGINPRGYFPHSYYLTLFSQENFSHFKKNKKFLNSYIELIPNRISSFECNNNKIIELREKYRLDKASHVFLKIGRISQFYSNSFIQSINLIKELNKTNAGIVLLIIGNIQDNKVYEFLKDYSYNVENIYIETDSYFTENAKELLDISSFVIGTGRGFMEACSKSKIMLVPAIDSMFPVLLDAANFKKAFDMNFSERIRFDNHTINDNLARLNKVLSSENEIEYLKLLSYQWFIDFFDLEKGKKSYDALYNSIEYKQSGSFDVCLHWLFVIRNNFGTWYRNFKRFFK